MEQNLTPVPHAVRTTSDIEADLLISCLFGGAEVLSRCVDAGISPEMFDVPTHRVIYERMLSLQHRRLPVTVAAIVEDLTLDGMRVLAHLSNRAPVAPPLDVPAQSRASQVDSGRSSFGAIVSALQKRLRRRAIVNPVRGAPPTRDDAFAEVPRHGL